MTNQTTTCPGHETTDGPAGISAYCDGSCQAGLCEACEEHPAAIGTDDLCTACNNRNEGLMLTQSMLENLTTLKNLLDEQERFWMNATDFEVTEARRTIKKLVEAHDATDDAIDRAGYGLDRS